MLARCSVRTARVACDVLGAKGGLTRQEAAARIWVDQGALTERGEREPTGAFLARVARFPNLVSEVNARGRFNAHDCDGQAASVASPFLLTAATVALPAGSLTAAERVLSRAPKCLKLDGEQAGCAE
jgi:hypothetical protein